MPQPNASPAPVLFTPPDFDTEDWRAPDMPGPGIAKAAMEKLLATRTADMPSWEGHLHESRLRDRYIAAYGFALLSAETLGVLAQLLAALNVLEVGAGSGYLSHALCALGVSVQASERGDDSAGRYGIRTVWQRDHEGDSAVLLPGEFEAVLMSWPPHRSPFASRIAHAMRCGQLLVYEGEGAGGCTADAAFFETVGDNRLFERLTEVEQRLNAGHLQFSCMHDRWFVYRKRAR